MLLIFIKDFSKDIKSLGFRKSLSQLKCGLEIPLLGFVVWCFVSSWVNVGTLEDLGTCVEEMRFVLGFYVLSYLFKKYSVRDFKYFYRSMFVPVLVAVCYGLYQMYTGHDLLRSNDLHLIKIGQYHRATGFFSLALTYAYVLCMFGIFGYSYFITHLKKRDKFFWLCVGIFTLSIIGTLASWTRGAWVGVYVAVLIVSFLENKTTAIKVFLVSAVAVGVFSFNGEFRERIFSIGNVTSDQSNTDRIDLWRTYFAIMKDNPIFGIGWNHNNDHLVSYFEKLEIKNGLIGHAHNDFIDIGCALGIPGLLMFVWFAFGFILKPYSALKHTLDPRTRSLVLGCLGAQIIFYVGSLTQSNFTDMEVNHTLFFIWALGESLISQRRSV